MSSITDTMAASHFRSRKYREMSAIEHTQCYEVRLSTDVCFKLTLNGKGNEVLGLQLITGGQFFYLDHVRVMELVNFLKTTLSRTLAS